MFGYVNVLKEELKIKDYNTYRAYYCGLCKMLGKNHNQLVRLSLNYDLTFLAIVIDALNGNAHNFVEAGCLKKIGKRNIIASADGLEFAADMNVILAYYKLKDDIRDKGSFGARIALLPFIRRASAIKKRYPDLCKTISDSLLRLAFLEEMQCDILDKSANEFAVIMQAMFETADSSLSKFGYELGRLIYIMDAFDDMDEDYASGNYNPAVLQYKYEGEVTAEIKSRLTDTLYYSLAELAEQYKKLDIKKNNAILDNIIYLGMRSRCDMIINNCNKRKETKV